MTADAAAAVSNRLGRQTGVAWALLIIAHLLGAPLACVWHCRAGADMAGMNHGAAQQPSSRISHQHAGVPAERVSAQSPGHGHHHASSAPANRPAASPATAAAPGDRSHSAPGQSLAMPCAPLGDSEELHPTAIFPATLARAPALEPAPNLDRLAAWDAPPRTRQRRPTIPPPRS